MLKDPQVLLMVLAVFILVVSLGLLFSLFFSLRRRRPNELITARLKELLSESPTANRMENDESRDAVLEL